MKIAYLILCHKNLDQVNTLINCLDDGNAAFFLHIDKKADDFNLKKKAHVYYVPDEKRVDVQWATMSMIDATLQLIDCTLNTEIEYDYYFLISGQDFPIKSNKKIQFFLEENKGANYIEVLDHDHPMYVRYHKRNDIYYPQWMFSRKRFVRGLKRVYIYLTGGYHHTFQLVKRKRFENITFEYGSQWWAVTHDCLKWMYQYIEESNILKYFEHSLTPDESVFQTVFMMSPFHDTRKDKIVYLEWNASQNNPRYMEYGDLKMLLEDECNLFARKFDSTIDNRIIKELIHETQGKI